MNAPFRRLFSAVLLLTAAAATAEVYWLGPKRSAAGGNVPPAESFEALSDARRLLVEPVRFNGVETELTVSLHARPLAELLAEWRRRWPDAGIHSDAAGTRLRLPPEHGWRQRVLLVGSAEHGSVTAFTMRLPERMPERVDWPESLPLPPGAEPEETIYFARRGSWYGAFRSDREPADNLRRIAAQLAAENFQPLSGEAAAGGNGELFLRRNPRELVWVTCRDGGGALSRTPLGRRDDGAADAEGGR